MTTRLRWLVPAAVALGLVFPASALADAPTADPKSPTTLEDNAVIVTLSGSDADGDALSFAISTGPTKGSLGSIGTPNCDGQTPSSCTADVTYTPNTDANGADSFTYTTNDGLTDSGAATVLISITAVNDVPSFTKGSNQTVLEDSGAASVSVWATTPSAGPSDESSQTLTFNVAATDTSLFSSQPQVASNGTLSFTPAADKNGSTIVTVSVSDNGGTSNGGVDTSGDQTFTIAITAVNDTPSFTKGIDETVAEDSGAAADSGWATGISPGPSNESAQTISFTVIATNTALFSSQPAVAANGDLTFTPAANAFGLTVVTVSAVDTGGTANGGDNTSAGQTFNISITAVNDPPTAHNDTLIVSQNAPATAVNVLANDTYLPDAPETLTISLTSQGSHGAVVITGGGSGLTYQPAALYQGTDTFTYTISDGTLTASATVLVSVGKDLIPPVGAAPLQTIRTGITMGSTIGVHLVWGAVDVGVGVGSYLLQESIDGGSYHTITLPTALTTSINRFLLVNHSYQYRMGPTDKNGNHGVLKYGPKFKVLRFQEGSGAISYNAFWSLFSNVNNSGGFSRYSSLAGHSATFTATARDFAFVAPMGTFRGTARIYVDGVLVASVSEHATSTLYRRVLWSTHFSTLATHSIRVLVVGPSRVDLDCFLILR